MNVSSQPLLVSASQPLKLPIPRLPSSFQTSSTWTSSSTSTNSAILNAQQIESTTQQQTTNKPRSKRGRKPLVSMPTTKKHIQNLTNQRAFRQRRETYIRSLENKASKFEVLLKGAKNEVESLKEQVALLEKQVDIEERICNNVEMTNTVISDENIRINNIIHNNNNINPFNGNNDDKINNDDNNNSEIQQPSQTSRCFTPFTTTNTPSFSFNDQHRLINQPPPISCSVPTLPTVEDIIRDPIFCETKGDLCFCEPGDDLVNEQSTATTATTGIDKCLTNDKQPVAKKQMWILPTTTIPSSLYSNYPGTPSHWELSNQQDYFSPSVSSVVTTTTHPLHLKWILGDR